MVYGYVPEIPDPHIAGNSGMPDGVIQPVLWAGDLKNIPDGYHICDGTHGTPDLRGRIVKPFGSKRKTPMKVPAGFTAVYLMKIS